MEPLLLCLWNYLVFSLSAFAGALLASAALTMGLQRFPVFEPFALPVAGLGAGCFGSAVHLMLACDPRARAPLPKLFPATFLLGAGAGLLVPFLGDGKAAFVLGFPVAWAFACLRFFRHREAQAERLHAEHIDARTPEALWEALGAIEGMDLVEAQAALAGRGPATVAFLAERLFPASTEPAEIDGLVASLDHVRPEVRDQAAAALRFLRRSLAQDLKTRLTPALPSAARARLERVLSEEAPLDAVPETARLLRGLTILGRIPLPESRALLERLAAGDEASDFTWEARRALAGHRLRRPV